MESGSTAAGFAAATVELPKVEIDVGTANKKRIELGDVAVGFSGGR